MSIGRIERVEMRFGAYPGSGPTDIDVGPVTVLVGLGYAAAANGDVWDFVARVVGWVKDPGRAGMSAG